MGKTQKTLILDSKHQSQLVNLSIEKGLLILNRIRNGCLKLRKVNNGTQIFAEKQDKYICKICVYQRPIKK